MPILALQVWAFFVVAPWLARMALARYATRRWARLPRVALLVVALTGTFVLAVGLRPFIAAFAPTYTLATVLLIGVPLAIAAALRRIPLGERLISGGLGVVASLCGGLLFWMTIFNIQYGYSNDCGAAVAEPRNRVLFGACKTGFEGQVRAIVGAHAELLDARQSRAVWPAADPRFVYTACGLEGTEAKDHPLLRIDRRTGAIDRSYVTSAVLDGSCDAGSRRCIVLLSAEKRFLIVDDGNGEIVHEAALPVGPRFVAMHGHQAMVGLAAPPVMMRVDLLTGEAVFPTAEESLYVGIATRGGGVAAVSGDPSTDDTFFTIEYPASSLGEILSFPSGPLATALIGYSPLGHGTLARLGLDPGKVTIGPLTPRDAFWSFGLMLGIAPDRSRNTVYFVSPTAGEMVAHDYDTLAFQWRLGLKAGARLSDIDRARGRLFAGDYAGGWLFVVDVDRRKIVDKLYAGRGIRQVRFDPSHDRVLVASRAGFVEIDVYGEESKAATPAP